MIKVHNRGKNGGFSPEVIDGFEVDEVELRQLIAKSTHLHVGDVSIVLEDLKRIVVEQVSGGNRVKLSGLGVFAAKVTKLNDQITANLGFMPHPRVKKEFNNIRVIK